MLQPQSILNEQQLSLLRILIQTEVKYALMEQQQTDPDLLEQQKEICNIVYDNFIQMST
jgi:hypothetical protein